MVKRVAVCSFYDMLLWIPIGLLHKITNRCILKRGHCKLDGQQASPKITKCHFLEDNQVSFWWVTGIDLKTTQFFSFQKISTNTVARGVSSFGRNGPWLAGWLSNGQNFFVNLAQTWDEDMLKISGRYLDFWMSNGQITENLL